MSSVLASAWLNIVTDTVQIHHDCNCDEVMMWEESDTSASATSTYT